MLKLSAWQTPWCIYKWSSSSNLFYHLPHSVAKWHVRFGVHGHIFLVTSSVIHLYSATHVPPKKDTQAIIDTAIFTTLNALIHILHGEFLVMGSWRCLRLGVSRGKNWVSPKSYVWVSPLLIQCTYRFTAYLAGAQCLFIYSIIDVLIALCLVLTV